MNHQQQQPQQQQQQQQQQLLREEIEGREGENETIGQMMSRAEQAFQRWKGRQQDEAWDSSPGWEEETVEDVYTPRVDGTSQDRIITLKAPSGTPQVETCSPSLTAAFPSSPSPSSPLPLLSPPLSRGLYVFLRQGIRFSPIGTKDSPFIALCDLWCALLQPWDARQRVETVDGYFREVRER